MYQVNISNQAKKDIKRLDKPVIRTLLKILDDIAENPHAGDPLKGNLSQEKIFITS